MNDLRAESYDANEVESKKRSIAKRAAVAGGTIALTLGLFSLAGCDRPESEPPIINGGAGAWFYSYPEDESTEDE